jgi:hypothetical protein
VSLAISSGQVGRVLDRVLFDVALVVLGALIGWAAL